MDNQKYLETKIRPIMDGMIFQLISERPDNPATFILDWLQKTGGYSQNGLTQDETEELEKLRSEINQFKSLQIADEVEKNLSDPDSDEEIKQNEIEDKKKIIKGKGKRTGVSAEAYGKFNKKENFIPRYIKKSETQIKRITSKITQSFVFNTLEDKGLQIVIGAMEEKIFYPGDYVIKQGDQGNCLYYVESGKLECFKKFPNNEEKLVKQYQDGDSFGELALLYNAPRAASVIAKTKCILWALDRETFIHIVKNEAVKKREKYEKFLKSVEAFRGMDSYELSMICDVLKPCVFKPGEYVIREGEVGDLFYIVEEGKAIVTKSIEPGKPPEIVMNYNKGSYFGELALIREAKRAANVIAETELHLLAMDRQSFKRLLTPNEDHLRWRSEMIYGKKLLL